MLIIIASILSGCATWDSPPTCSSVEQEFSRNYSTIMTIVNYLINSEYDDVYIVDVSGEMMADLMHVNISKDEVNDAIDQLLGSGTYKSFVKIGNTIRILQWRGTQDIGCGIAYSINLVDLPEIEYMTKLEPLAVDGWFYYVDDYNTWRAKE